MAARYIDVFIDANSNTPEGCGLRFKAEGEPQPISHVFYEGQRCQVTGWSSAGGGSPCSAMSVVVEDSSAGTAVLIFSSPTPTEDAAESWGLRLTPESGAPFGEPYLLLDQSAIDCT